MIKNKSLKHISVILGVSGAFGIFAIFAGILLLVNRSFDSALQEFSRVWYWSILLSSGFGVQLGLYAHLRSRVHQKFPGATAEVAASGTISTGSMIACCAHALVNILPILGLSAAAALLAAFQLPFILLGVFSNFFGMTIMLGILKKHNFVPQHFLFTWVNRVNMIDVRNSIALVSVIVVVTAFALTAFLTDQFALGTDEAVAEEVIPMAEITPIKPGTMEILKENATQEEESPVFVLSAQQNNQRAVSVNIMPHELRFEEPVQFDISFNTHNVALDFDVTAIASLNDDHGNVYAPLKWEGSEPGGHHRSGTLIFPKIPESTTAMTLILHNIANVPERVFTWKLEE